MRILLIRHGEPDYARDTLTEKGWREAELLSERMAKEDITEFYVSPLGRAKDTASLTIEKMHRTAKEYKWLREFAPRIQKPYEGNRRSIVWDWLPEEWTAREEFYDPDLWYSEKELQEAGVKQEYDWVVGEFDKLLAEHGYVREGKIYRAEHSNKDTLAFFCHFGLSCVLLSHLMNISPMVLWHSTCLAPTSVSSLYTEERQKGKVIFRANCLGDTSHLYVHDEAPSLSARFRETYDSLDDTQHQK